MAGVDPSVYCISDYALTSSHVRFVRTEKCTRFVGYINSSGIACLAQGNTHAKGTTHAEPLPQGDDFHSGAPMEGSNSALTYSEQVSLKPYDGSGSGRGTGAVPGSEYHGIAGYPAQPKLVPSVIVCERPYP